MTISNRNTMTTILLIYIMMMNAAVLLMTESYTLSSDVMDGAYADEITFSVMTNETDAIAALLDGEIDLIGDDVDSSCIQELEEAANIETAEHLRNEYGCIAINCDMYPLNITAFRRACAIAVDKEAISREVLDNMSVPLDGCVPKVNPFSVEGQLDYDYYTSNIELGNTTLDAAGFDDVDYDGFREAPNGEDFTVLIECHLYSEIEYDIASRVADALQALGVDARAEPTVWYEAMNRLSYNGDYDMILLRPGWIQWYDLMPYLDDFNVDWLAYEYWSENADNPDRNLPRFQNDTYDSWRNQLLYSPGYEDTYQAAIEMQKIWTYQCPMLVLYEPLETFAYRTDRFDGFKNDLDGGVPGYWTNYKAHLKESEGGPLGGTLRWSIPEDLDSFNMMTSASESTIKVLSMLYDSLIVQDWEGNDVNWLTTDYTVETHDDNSEIPEGRVRFTFDIVEHATWTDGEDLTPVDIAFSLNYYRDATDHPFSSGLDRLTAVFAPPDENTVIVEFSNGSYWNLRAIGSKPIIPKDVFVEIGLNGWDEWSPSPPDQEMVTSGPYNVTGYVPGDSCTLSRNSNHFHLLEEAETTTTTISETTPTSNGLFPAPDILLIVTLASIGVIVVVGVLIIRRRKS